MSSLKMCKYVRTMLLILLNKVDSFIKNEKLGDLSLKDKVEICFSLFGKVYLEDVEMIFNCIHKWNSIKNKKLSDDNVLYIILIVYSMNINDNSRFSICSFKSIFDNYSSKKLLETLYIINSEIYK